MKEVDWDIAPKGATHYNAECEYPWLKEKPISYFKGDYWNEYSTFFYENAMKHIKNAIKRPQGWDGVGLPPVGTVCEYLKNAKYKTSWIKVRVVFIGRNLIFFEHGASGKEFTEKIATVSFRTIKTPEQIAAEERLDAIDEMVVLAQHSGSTYKDVMSALYDVGYRKVEV